MSAFQYFGLSFFAVLVVTGCTGPDNAPAMPSAEVQQLAGQSRPVNCASALGDIRILEAERAAIGDRIIAGEGTVTPTVDIAAILTDGYDAQREVAAEKYHNDIKTKISQIRLSCDVY